MWFFMNLVELTLTCESRIFSIAEMKKFDIWYSKISNIKFTLKPSTINQKQFFSFKINAFIYKTSCNLPRFVVEHFGCMDEESGTKRSIYLKKVKF